MLGINTEIKSGSPKQIEWAKKIKSEKVKSLAHLITLITPKTKTQYQTVNEQIQRANTIYSTDSITFERVSGAIEVAAQKVVDNTDSKFWIDNRDMVVTSLVGLFIADDLTIVKKSIKNDDTQEQRYLNNATVALLDSIFAAYYKELAQAAKN